jgi:uncharacterized protein YcfJ
MKFSVLISALVLSASIANADVNPSNIAVITAVQPVYSYRYIPKYDTQCYDVEVPIYSTIRGGSNGDVFAGAVIGGAIGNQFGNGSGKDAMTMLGAILGANQGANSTRDVITGYRLEQRCDQVKVHVNEPVLTHYNIKYTLDGVEYTEKTTRKYTIGQRVKVSVSLN